VASVSEHACLFPDHPRIDAVVMQLVGVADEPALDDAVVGFQVELEAERAPHREGLMGEAGGVRQGLRAGGDRELVPMPVEHGLAVERGQDGLPALGG